MGWGFRKSIKIAPGLRVNLSKSGISTSIGGKGLTYNTRGRVTASIPGTGIRFTHSMKARRTANPVRSVVAGSSRIDSTTTDRLSKREQAARDFVAQVQSRTTDALLQYLLSHGVYVRRDELSEAVTLEEHQGFLETLNREFDATTKSIKLAVDIGSISLAEKEKAMLAVYEIERKCSANLGERGQLASEAVSLANAVVLWPKSPNFVAPFLAGLLGSFFIFLNSFPIGLVFLAVGFGYGLFSLKSFSKKRAAAIEAFEAANARFDSLLEVEISPRPALAEADDLMREKAIAFVVLTVVIAVLAGYHRTQDGHQEAAVPSGTEAIVASAANTVAQEQAGSQHPDFSWLVGKYPSDVATDKRFRAAFNHISRADWKKFVDRLAVNDAAGIQRKDGYIVGEGCKAHLCNSDNAAFVINATTGRGDIVFRETVDYSSGKAVVKSVTWKDLPLESTPLADWIQSNNNAPMSAAPVSTAPVSAPATQQTSFDCSKARSDAEHLVCNDPELAADDVELASIYAKAKAAATDQIAFKVRTRAEWNYREQTCHDRECLVRWYADQKTALQQIAETGNVAGN
ncbi:DUF4236 domain-containing protein [Paraburkholderia sp. SOS3]|uniref:DUF4236 domain-containing protein n=1 Tax=Paraburkholderia sp. SOS3 TaxID=1926494 RepID=UPI0009476868|nr:DUF4236 domain-containing protein [Paraburkholderia sp. SOS3]APR37239.1 hypothetical protein BTO02_19600 [Paraburkholderia sp. SOS3]